MAEETTATTGIVTVPQLRDYLGVDEEKDSEIQMLLSSAIEIINRATGLDWETMPKVESFNEALRVQVYISYYAVRDASKNTAFLQEHLSGLINSLQLCRHEQGVEPDGV